MKYRYPPPPDDGVRASAAVEDVVAPVAGHGIGERVAGAVDGGSARQRQVLDVGPRVNVTFDLTESLPWPAFSIVLSPALSTM